MSKGPRLTNLNQYAVRLMQMHDIPYNKRWNEAFQKGASSEQLRQLQAPAQPCTDGSCSQCGNTVRGLPEWAFKGRWAMCLSCALRTGAYEAAEQKAYEMAGPVDETKMWEHIHSCVAKMGERLVKKKREEAEKNPNYDAQHGGVRLGHEEVERAMLLEYPPWTWDPEWKDQKVFYTQTGKEPEVLEPEWEDQVRGYKVINETIAQREADRLCHPDEETEQ